MPRIDDLKIIIHLSKNDNLLAEMASLAGLNSKPKPNIQKVMIETTQQLEKNNAESKLSLDIDGLLPSIDELQPFLYWVFHKADRIWVEHTLGWREKAIEEMYEAYKNTKK